MSVVQIQTITKPLAVKNIVLPVTNHKEVNPLHTYHYHSHKAVIVSADTVLKLGGTNSGAKCRKKVFLSCPPKFALCPQFRGHSGDKALLTWRLADIHDVCATRNLKQKVYDT